MTEAEMREAMAERRQWVHQPGDRYYAIVEKDSGFRPVAVASTPTDLRAVASPQVGHDDYHVAVVRQDEAVAVIWSIRWVDTDAEVLELVAKGLGL